MSKQIVLAMDSSGPQFLAGITDGEKTYILRRTGIKQERFFLSVIEKLLAKANAQLSDIKQVCFVRGPGRFTGLRISMTFASMLKMLNSTAVFSATLFDILYMQVKQSVAFSKWKKAHPTGVVAIVLHAFREEYFLQFFDGKHTEPQWLSKEELIAKLASRKEPLYIAGADKDGSPLNILLDDKYRFAPQVDNHVRAASLLALANHPIYQKNALEPLYLKPARFELGQ